MSMLVPAWSGFRSRRRNMVKAESPRYASVFPPPVGNQMTSTRSRSGQAGSAIALRFMRMNASWNGRHMRFGSS